MTVPLLTSVTKTNLLKTNYINILWFFLIFFVFGASLWKFISTKNDYSNNLNLKVTLDLSNIQEIVLEDDSELARARNPNCSFWDCFNVYRCGQRTEDRISIYVYPLASYVDSNGKSAFTLSREFYFILKTIIDSPYYTPNPLDACLLIPSIDVLNQNRIDTHLVGKALASLP